MRTAIIFFTHLFDGETLLALEQLRRESKAHGELHVLTEHPDRVPSYLLPQVHVFDFAALKHEFPSALGGTVVPGNCHLALIDFVRHHNDFDHYWVIEYDVRFSGNWMAFFEAFADNDADLLGSEVRRRQDKPDWYWWHTLTGPQGRPVPPEHSARAFLPVQRISRQAIAEVQARASEGWSGHFECLVPTTVLAAGLRVAEIGGDGEFTPAHLRNRFCTGETMRYRPPHDDSPRTSNMLYHPVKPAAWPSPRASAPGWVIRRQF